MPALLSVRPVVISSEETLTIELVEGGESMITIDGQEDCGIREGDRIRIGQKRPGDESYRDRRLRFL